MNNQEKFNQPSKSVVEDSKNNIEIPYIFGNFLKNSRSVNKKLRKIIAIELGLSPKTLDTWESGYGFPKDDEEDHGDKVYTLEAIARAYGIVSDDDKDYESKMEEFRSKLSISRQTHDSMKKSRWAPSNTNKINHNKIS